MDEIPPCRRGLIAHDWQEGQFSRWCGVCWLAQRYADLRRYRPREITRMGAPPPAPRARKTKTASRSRRAQVIERDGLDCHYCDRTCVETRDETRGDRLTIDHVIPRRRGGTNDLDNLVVACSDCNSAKDDLLLEDFAGKVVDADPPIVLRS